MEVNYKVSGYGKYTKYRLLLDEIEIKNGELLGPSSTVKYPLNEIRPTPSKVVKRNYELNPFQFAGAIFGVAGIVYLSMAHFDEAWMIFASLAVYGCLISGLVLLRAKVEYSVFHFLDHTPLFGIAKKGKQKNQYESFVGALTERITYANQALDSIGTSCAGPDRVS